MMTMGHLQRDLEESSKRAKCRADEWGEFRVAGDELLVFGSGLVSTRRDWLRRNGSGGRYESGGETGGNNDRRNGRNGW